jgi:hypothetical protein
MPNPGIDRRRFPIPMLTMRTRFLSVAALVAWSCAVPARTLNDGISVGLSGIPSPGDALLAVYDIDAGQTLLVNTHWRYADIVNGFGVPAVDLASDPNFQAIQGHALAYNLVGAYGVYQNPDTGKANLDKNGAELPFDDDVPGNAQWGVLTTGQAADGFSADVNDLYNTQFNGVQTYWTAVNTELATIGATEDAGPDSVLVGADSEASWDLVGWGSLASSGLVTFSDGTRIDGLGQPAKLFWVTNPSLDAANPNQVTELGSVQLSNAGRLAYTKAGGEPPINRPPTVTIKAPTTAVKPGALASLDGSASADPDGDSISYAWTQTAGPAQVDVQGAASAVASFKADVVGDYAFALTVTDSQGASTAGTAQVQVAEPQNHAPTASASAVSPVNAGAEVVLDGSASADPDAEDSLTYQWTLLSGPAVPQLTGADSPQASFQADTAGDYTFQLTVTDAKGASDAAAVEVSVNPNRAPVARASADVRVATGVTVTLDGSASSDPEQGALSYAWELLSGPDQPALSGGNAAVASFEPGVAGVYSFRLTVKDPQGAASAATVQVKAGPGFFINAPTTWLVGRGQAIGVTGFQLKDKARAVLRFSKDGQRFVPIGKVSLKKGSYQWKPGKRQATRAGIIQACLDARKPATCDQAENIVVKVLPE